MAHTMGNEIDDSYTLFTPEVKEKNRWFMVLGVVMFLLGIAAVAFPFVATLAMELLIGWIFTISGVIGMVTAFRTPKWKGFLFEILGSLLALGIGLVLLFFPMAGMLSLTLLVAAFLIASGIFRIFLAFTLRPLDHWGWQIVSGVLALVLAGLILAQLPHAANWVIGLLVGIDLMFSGMIMIMLATTARRSAA
ncbi:hypothetical protein CWI75_16100 [Kineobactrum sediminis]|uniref:HdeD family acid-resistance protein n=1 Tax=Kineobactrum sediminis TaxID=1905677 RepID=A0A2N5XYY2_9GAMM|nr:HdeD family acid-resistance protein [Kineobactrum sediminis]PLW81354.1 hypothetical protein CWI75_16100 [Kineobactrum sediminis]